MARSESARAAASETIWRESASNARDPVMRPPTNSMPA
jgi:hypothetical protein